MLDNPIRLFNNALNPMTRLHPKDACQVMWQVALVACLFCFPALSTLAQDAPPGASAPDAELSDADADALLDDETSGDDQPIVMELAHGVDLLNEQIETQQQLLKTAQTAREQQLIQNHIRLLQKERRSLQSLLHKLVGPGFDVREAAREQQSEHRAERESKRLEIRSDERSAGP